uniref:Glutamate receptor n=1 Tax=Noccaea caerulescens TaxID=107243 RepID=A0A1J3D4J9_NOCCA
MRTKKLFFLVLFNFSFFFLVELSRGQNNSKTEVNIGIVTDVGTSYSDVSMLCINMSLVDIYSSRPQFQTRLVVNVGDSRNDVVGAAAAALELIKNKQVKAILGPWTSMQAHFLIEIGQKSRVPVVSYSATSPFLTSLRSPYFFRATYEDSSQVHAITAIIKLFGWREVVPVYIDNTFGEGVMPRLTDALQEINVRIPYRSAIALHATDSEISVELLKMMTMPTRVFIVHMNYTLASRVFTKAKEIGLMKPGYVWILTNAVTDSLSLIDKTGIEAMEGVLGVKTYIRKSEDLDKFRARWSKLFPRLELSVYGLWAYDAITALAIAIEEAGTGNLTFSKADAGRNVSELEALGVSQYGPKLLQTLSSVHFQGLAGDFRFVNGQLQPSVFEIVNLVGTGEKLIGFWTEENGLVKTLDQQPQSNSALSTWKDHLKRITWPGEGDSIPKGWEIPTNGKKLRIGVPKKTGFTDLLNVTRDPITNATIVTGFCIDFFKAVIEKMPYDISYELIPFEKSNGEPAGNYNDLVHQVYLGRYDAVVGDTTILANRSSYVDFTLPFMRSGVGLIVPMEDLVKRDKYSFLKPLSWRLWLTSLLFFFLIGITVWAVEHRVNPDFRGPARYQASTIFWFAFSTMVFAPRERVFSFGARILVITWYFIVLVLTQSYTASLASLLTSQQLHPTITNMRSLLEKGEAVGYQRTSFILGKLVEAGFTESRLVPFDTAEDCHELLRKEPENGGVSAAFLETPYMRLFLGQYCTAYKMVEESFNVDGFGFVFPIGSPLVADVSRAILKVAESPKAMELDRAWFKKKDESCPDPLTNPDPNPSVTSRQLGLDSFWVLFLIAGLMCVFTLGKFIVCFMLETGGNGLWEAFNRPPTDSYINNVEKCPCVAPADPTHPADPVNPAPPAGAEVDMDDPAGAEVEPADQAAAEVALGSPAHRAAAEVEIFPLLLKY